MKNTKADVLGKAKDRGYTGVLPSVALDHKAFLDRLKYSRFDGIPFFVLDYTISAGRLIDTTPFDKAKKITAGRGSKSTTMSGVGSKRGFATKKSVFNLDEKSKQVAINTQRDYNLKKAVEKAKILGQGTGLASVGDHPIPKDRGMNPNKITLHIFFKDVIEQTKSADTEVTFEGVFKWSEDKGTYRDNFTRLDYNPSSNILYPYTVLRDRFLKAVADPSPRYLELPSYGKFLAIPGKVDIKYDGDKGGIEYVTAVFYRATKDIEIQNKVSNKVAIDSRINAVNAMSHYTVVKIKQEMLNRHKNPSGFLPTKITERLAENSENFLELSKKNVNKMISTLVKAEQVAFSTIDSYNRQIRKISNTITTLVQTPEKFADHLLDAYKTLNKSITQPIEAYNHFKNSIHSFLDIVEGITYSTLDTLGLDREKVSEAVLHIGYSFTFLSESAIDTEFESTNQVTIAKEDLTAIYNRVIGLITSFPEYDDLSTTISSLYGDVLEYLGDELDRQPTETTLSIKEDTPLLVTSYDLYGTTLYVDSMAARNNVPNKLFPPTQLKVLI